MNRPLPPIEDLSVFLKLLYESTKDKPTYFSIGKTAKEYNLMYYNTLSTILRKKGIIEQHARKKWLWISTTEPNVHMSEAVIKACSKYIHGHQQLKEDNTKTIKVTIHESVTPLVVLRNQIHEMKIALINLGWSEDDAITLIRQQIK